MAKAFELEKHLAAIGAAGAPTIEHVRRCLRRTPLLQCSGQGYAARDIIASDVTNIFLALAIAVPNQINKAPAIITTARASKVYVDRCENCHPWPFDGVTNGATLGEFLDVLFAGRISSASEPGCNNWDMRFEFQITDGSFRQFSKLIFEVGDQQHVVHFFGLNPHVREKLDGGSQEALPTTPDFEPWRVVKSRFLRGLIAFTTGALNPEQAATAPAIDINNPFLRNGVQQRDT